MAADDADRDVGHAGGTHQLRQVLVIGTRHEQDRIARGGGLNGVR